MNGRARVMVVLTGVESTFLNSQAKWSLGPLKVGGS
jgi:hypothetical protein